MPTYDYVCDDCGFGFEEFHSITADALEICPECKKPKLRRLIGGGAAILFKGPGFYETDYRSESYKKDATKNEADSLAKSDATKSDAAKSDAAKSDATKSDAGKSDATKTSAAKNNDSSKKGEKD